MKYDFGPPSVWKEVLKRAEEGEVVRLAVIATVNDVDDKLESLGKYLGMTMVSDKEKETWNKGSSIGWAADFKKAESGII